LGHREGELLRRPGDSALTIFLWLAADVLAFFYH
jgi:hypothetical protein